MLLAVAGLVFSEDEGSALVQFDGGPCAVIAPVQGFLLKNLLFGETRPTPEWNQLSSEILIYISAYGDDLIFVYSVKCLYMFLKNPKCTI